MCIMTPRTKGESRRFADTHARPVQAPDCVVRSCCEAPKRSTAPSGADQQEGATEGNDGAPIGLSPRVEDHRSHPGADCHREDTREPGSAGPRGLSITTDHRSDGLAPEAAGSGCARDFRGRGKATSWHGQTSQRALRAACAAGFIGARRATVDHKDRNHSSDR